MKVNPRKISGAWADGYALDKHTESSTFIGYNEYGYPQFETMRTPVGEAVYQLKYRSDFEQVVPLAQEVVFNIVPCFPKIGLVLPAPASTTRARQPVHEVAAAVADRIDVPLFDNIIVKSNVEGNNRSLKDMNDREEKVEALKGRFLLKRPITNEGCWNPLIIDDLHHTGATMDAICSLLRQYDKIKEIYVATLTWR